MLHSPGLVSPPELVVQCILGLTPVTQQRLGDLLHIFAHASAFAISTEVTNIFINQLRLLFYLVAVLEHLGVLPNLDKQFLIFVGLTLAALDLLPPDL